MFEGLRTSTELIVIVVTLLAFGCPVQAIVQAYGLDERTVASWRERAGKQCQRVHQALVEQGQVDLVQVQADEIRVKARGMIAWMGLAIMVSTRLWLGGVVSRTRDSSLADRLLLQVRACAPAACEVLICTDGWAAYPASIKRAFADLVGFAHWDGHQAHSQEAADWSGASDESWFSRAGDAALAAWRREGRCSTRPTSNGSMAPCVNDWPP